MAHIYLAQKTMDAIDEGVRVDQGSKYREWLGKVIPTISDAYDPRNGRRTHLGISNIGDPCARKIFFGFRWVARQNHSGRILRLFNRGHMEEGRFIAALLAAGMKIYQQDSEGKQFRLSEYGGHVGSAIDGVIVGCPDLQDPNTPVLTEMKTHGDKSYKKLLKEGVRESKYMHYVQMQVYMKKMGLGAALYIAVNKNTDEIYCELIPYDSVVADQYIDRAVNIAAADEAPVGLSTKGAGWFECKMCDYNDVCYRGELPVVSCRTCRYAIALPNGTWHCRNSVINQTLTTDEQISACSHYELASYYGKR